MCAIATIVRSCTRYIVMQLVKMRDMWDSIALISGIVLAGHMGPVFNHSVSNCLQVASYSRAHGVALHSFPVLY